LITVFKKSHLNDNGLSDKLWSPLLLFKIQSKKLKSSQWWCKFATETSYHAALNKSGIYLLVINA